MDVHPHVVAREAGSLIRDVRRRRGLTQHQLALRSGTTQAAISRLERGGRSPSIDTVERLLLVMGAELVLTASRPDGAIHDAEEIRRSRSLGLAERLDRAFAWNAFAATVSGAASRAETGERR